MCVCLVCNCVVDFEKLYKAHVGYDFDHTRLKKDSPMPHYKFRLNHRNIEQGSNLIKMITHFCPSAFIYDSKKMWLS